MKVCKMEYWRSAIANCGPILNCYWFCRQCDKIRYYVCCVVYTVLQFPCLCVCHTLPNSMRRNAIVPVQCHICYNFTINCFDGSGTKMQFALLHRLNIGCLVRARNVSATMAANHSICDVQLFQFKNRKWNNLRSNCKPISFLAVFFLWKTAFVPRSSQTRTDNGDTHWNCCTQL